LRTRNHPQPAAPAAIDLRPAGEAGSSAERGLKSQNVSAEGS
jgi:hypothetical protein